MKRLKWWVIPMLYTIGIFLGTWYLIVTKL